MVEFITHSPEETEALAATIGGRLRGWETVELISDLGGGKTTFVRGLTRGAGSQDHVASPTFALSKVYNAPGFEILHFDFYRLTEAGVLEHEVRDAWQGRKAVLVVEWAETVRHVLPKDRVTVRLTAANDSNERKITITSGGQFKYLVEGL